MWQHQWQQLRRPAMVAFVGCTAKFNMADSQYRQAVRCDVKARDRVTRMTNVKVVRGGVVTGGDLWFSGGRILVGTSHACILNGSEHGADITLDGHGSLVIPGFIDPQLNGAFGVDFSSPKLTSKDVAKVARGLLAHGVTSFMPTVVTAAPHVYKTVLPKLSPHQGGVHGAEILGAHCIGPFISKEHCGTHPERLIKDTLPLGFKDVTAMYGQDHIANGTVRLVTLAPELEGAMEAIAGLTSAGTFVSIGHSSAGIENAEAAVCNGARFITHLFNAMKTFHHRDPGLVGLLATADPTLRVHYGLIVDGVHVHPAAVKSALKTHGEGCVLVTDAMSALGLGNGSHSLGDIDVVVEDAPAWGRAVVPQARKVGTNSLVGGVVDMHSCFLNLMAFTGCDVVTAAECASTHAANLLGLGRKGRLDPGCDADFLLLDPNTYHLRETWIGGHCAWSRPSVEASQKIETLQKQVERNLFVGIDIGGTTISVGVVDDSGAICGEVVSSNIGEDRTPSAIVDQLVDLVHLAVKAANAKVHDVNGFGMCTPGLVNSTLGVVVSAANLPWREVPISSLLAQKLGVDLSIVTLENDANAALLAEVWVGAGDGRDNVVMLTLGTGIGGSIVCDGHLLHGKDCGAGELGHTILVPDGRAFGGAGVDGIFEAYGSATAVVARAVEALPPDSSLCKIQPITCKDVFEQAERGDQYAQRIVQDTAKYIAVGCINIARNFSPEIIVFTGGMTLAGEGFIEMIREQYKKYHWNVAPICVDIRLAKMGNAAGVIGAACASRHTVGTRAVRRFEAPAA